jgi:5-methylcytosine-specific restriction protein A
MYGDLGKDFIHVHHIIPIHKIGKEYKINYIKDLIPVCPNCHAMLHRKLDGKEVDIEELKIILERNRK